jgi:hypothetical protein
MKHAKTEEMIALEDERDRALAHAKKCDDAIELLRTIQKRAQKALTTIDKVRVRVAASAKPKPTLKATRVNGTPKGYHSNAIKLRRRKETAAKLARFDSEQPRSASETRVGAEVATLIRHGYLRQVGDDGFVRTEKPFDIHAK